MGKNIGLLLVIYALVLQGLTSTGLAIETSPAPFRVMVIPVQNPDPNQLRFNVEVISNQKNAQHVITSDTRPPFHIQVLDEKGEDILRKGVYVLRTSDLPGQIRIWLAPEGRRLYPITMRSYLDVKGQSRPIPPGIYKVIVSLWYRTLAKPPTFMAEVQSASVQFEVGKASSGTQMSPPISVEIRSWGEPHNSGVQCIVDLINKTDATVTIETRETEPPFYFDVVNMQGQNLTRMHTGANYSALPRNVPLEFAPGEIKSYPITITAYRDGNGKFEPFSPGLYKVTATLPFITWLKRHGQIDNYVSSPVEIMVDK